jgi:hypothetical protein
MRLRVVSVAILASVAGSALAEGTPLIQQQPATNAATGAWSAPTGHRQPTQMDLLSSMVRDKDSCKESPERDFGPFRSICRGC